MKTKEIDFVFWIGVLMLFIGLVGVVLLYGNLDSKIKFISTLGAYFLFVMGVLIVADKEVN